MLVKVLPLMEASTTKPSKVDSVVKLDQKSRVMLPPAVKEGSVRNCEPTLATSSVNTELGAELAAGVTTVQAAPAPKPPAVDQPAGIAREPSKFSQTWAEAAQVLGEQTVVAVVPEGQVAAARKTQPPKLLQHALVVTGQVLPAPQATPRPWKRPLVQAVAEVCVQPPALEQQAPVCGQGLGEQALPLATLPEAQVVPLTKAHTPVVVLQQAVTGFGQTPALQTVPTPWKKLGAEQLLLVVTEQEPSLAQHAPLTTAVL